MAMKSLRSTICRSATVRARAVSQPQQAPKWVKAGLLASTAAIIVEVSPALAEDVDGIDVDTAVETVVGAVKTSGDFVKSSITTIEGVIQVLKQGYDVASPVVEQGIKAISPVVQQAIDAASPTLKSALPAITSAEQSLEASIKSEALDTVVDTASKAVTAASPIASKVASFVASSDPVTLGEYALGSAAFLYLFPSLLGVVAGLTRGFAGEITAAQVLDALNDGAVLIDIRTEGEKDASGVPDVPSSVSSKLIEVEFATIEDRKLRGSVRNANSLECTITALQIASLKRISGSSKLILLDRYGATARSVAQELSRKGFGKVYTIQGGFDGRNGWVQSKLQIKPSATALSTPAPAPKLPFGTRKALPSPSKP